MAAKPPLSWSVLGTLAWFGLRGRPLTLREISRLLLKQATPPENLLRVVTEDTRIQERDGYYSLKGDSVQYPGAASLKLYRYKWWRLRAAVGLLRHVPFLRLVGALQTMHNRGTTSPHDIDVLIVVQHGRLYGTRLLVTGLLHVAGLRRHGRKVANRIDLSWYATTAHLDMKPVTLPPYDLLLAYLFAELVPVLDTADTYGRFTEANRWVREFIPGFGRQGFAPPRPSLLARLGERLGGGRFGDVAERWAGRWQQRRITRKPASPDPDVEIIATDSMLKFHEKERRRTDRETWEKRMRDLGCDPALVVR